MIRPATLSDKERVIVLLRDSRAGAGFDRPDGATGFVFPFDPAFAERLFLAHLSGPHACCLIHDVDGRAQGILMAFAYQHPFGPVWVARETVWWIDPAHRGRAALQMLEAYDTWWASEGCQFGGMAGMGEDPDVRILYERRGYRPAELHFLKAA